MHAGSKTCGSKSDYTCRQSFELDNVSQYRFHGNAGAQGSLRDLQGSQLRQAKWTKQTNIVAHRGCRELPDQEHAANVAGINVCYCMWDARVSQDLHDHHRYHHSLENAQRSTHLLRPARQLLQLVCCLRASDPPKTASGHRSVNAHGHQSGPVHKPKKGILTHACKYQTVEHDCLSADYAGLVQAAADAGACVSKALCVLLCRGCQGVVRQDWQLSCALSVTDRHHKGTM